MATSSSIPATQPAEKKAGLAHWANRVLEESDKAEAGFASDPVHDLRVAIRRCRSMADGFLSVDPDPAWKQMKRLAKPLFSALGDLRDTQVMMEWVTKFAPEGDAIASQLCQELATRESSLKDAAKKALADFDRKRWAALNDHLAKRTDRVPPEGLVFRHVALERWIDARELHRHALRNRSGSAWHQLRIGIKRFRYTVENFLPELHSRWGKDLRSLQDALGEVHDFDVLRAQLRTHSGLPAGERKYWHDRILAERQKRLDLYRAKMLGAKSLWNAWRAELPSGAELEEAALEKLRTWAAFLDPAPAHTRLVTRLALRLYDELLQCGIAHISRDERRILEAGAWLHEVGRSGSGNGHGAGHRRRGAKLVDKLTPPLGWSTQDLAGVSLLVRYHRGPLPDETKKNFAGLSARRTREVMTLIGILRLANAFDADRKQHVSDIGITRQDGLLVIHAKGLQPMSRNAELIARARHLLETMCEIGIVVRPTATVVRTNEEVRRLPSPVRSTRLSYKDRR